MRLATTPISEARQYIPLLIDSIEFHRATALRMRLLDADGLTVLVDSEDFRISDRFGNYDIARRLVAFQSAMSARTL